MADLGRKCLNGMAERYSGNDGQPVCAIPGWNLTVDSLNVAKTTAKNRLVQGLYNVYIISVV